jgi:two-component system OmpR family response regulator
VTIRDHAHWTGQVVPGRPSGLVVVAEHEPEVAEMARRYLAKARLAAEVTASPVEAVALLRARAAAAYVLDLTMPGLDIRLVRRALVSGPATAVVFLMDPRAIRPRGLGAVPGSRRWLVRPFSPRALVEAVRETLIPPQSQAPAEEAGAGWLREARLTAGEETVLAALETAAGRVLTREELVAAVAAGRGTTRHGKTPGPRVIDVYVTQLRAKLGSDSIRTVRGTGYALRTSWQGKPTANSRGPAPGGSESALGSREVTFPI